jgi:hypothetical protein
LSKALPFTSASLARAIKGIEAAGRFAVGLKLDDGTLIIGDKPVDTASLIPAQVHDAHASKWEDQQG